MEGFVDFKSPRIWDLFDLLKPDTAPLWGKMTAQHMVEHLILPLKIARGAYAVEIVTPANKVERVKQIMLLGTAPLKKGFAAPFLPEDLLPLTYASISEAIVALKLEWGAFEEYYKLENSVPCAHPVFGILTKEEWYLFQRKHFTHHLAQFGLS